MNEFEEQFPGLKDKRYHPEKGYDDGPAVMEQFDDYLDEWVYIEDIKENCLDKQLVKEELNKIISSLNSHLYLLNKVKCEDGQRSLCIAAMADIQNIKGKWGLE